MPDRAPVLAANWKMHKTVEETEGFLDAFLARVPGSGAEVIICPPFLSLTAAVDRCAQSSARVAAQNMHDQPEGAFTGEVSAPMLVEIGVDGVILGHSERRQYFGESDEALARKVPAALDAGLQPILCVGENESQRDANETEGILTGRSRRTCPRSPEDRLGDIVIAYEPIWAIGTGRTATPEQAQDACALIRGLIETRSGDAAGRDPDPLRRVGEAGQRGRAARAARRRRRARGRRGASTRTTSRRSWKRPPDVASARAGEPAGALPHARGPGRLWPGPEWPRQCRVAGEHAELRRALDQLSAHDSLDLGTGRRPARRANGQLGGRSPQPGRRRGRQAGPGADRRRDRRWQLLRERGPARGLRLGARVPARAPARDRADLGRRGPLRLGAHRGDASSWRGRRASQTW